MKGNFENCRPSPAKKSLFSCNIVTSGFPMLDGRWNYWTERADRGGSLS